MKIIKSPWKDELMELVSNADESIKITSPFVKSNVCSELISNKKKLTKIEFITSFKLMNVYSGSIDLKSFENILSNSGSIYNFSKLHAKIYLFDNKKAIITSGNLTSGGLLNNYEYGIYTEDNQIVNQIVNDFNSLVVHKDTGKINQTHINEVRNIISKLPKILPVNLPKYNLNEYNDEERDIIQIREDVLISFLKGWKLEVYKCINSIEHNIFTLNELNKFESLLKTKYPNNNNIKDKIRQQLQYLRDLGLIEFLGNGQYKKLWK